MKEKNSKIIQESRCAYSILPIWLFYYSFFSSTRVERRG